AHPRPPWMDTLHLHDALPICSRKCRFGGRRNRVIVLTAGCERITLRLHHRTRSTGGIEVKPGQIVAAAVLVLGTLINPAAGSEAPLLTLEEALRLARVQNYQMQNAGLQIDVVEEQKKSVAAKRYPRLSAQLHGVRNFVDSEYTFEKGSL